MTTENSVTKTSGNPLAILGSKFQVDSASMVEVLRGTVIKPGKDNRQATNEELVMFAIVANQYDLNPFTREIYAFAAPGKGIVAIVPIDGWTKIVNRHKDSNGQNDFDGCEFVEVDGKNGLPESITCKLHIKGRSVPVSVTERYAECKRDTSPWAQHPYRMLRHKAYMQAARYAFGLGGIHDEDEARDIMKNVTPTTDRTPISAPRTSDRPAVTLPAAVTETTVPAAPKASEPNIQQERPTDKTVVTVTLGKITTKEGDGAKGKWLKYSAKGDDGKWYATFNTDIQKLMAKLEGDEVTIWYTEDKFGRTIERLELVHSQDTETVSGEPVEENDNVDPNLVAPAEETKEDKMPLLKSIADKRRYSPKTFAKSCLDADVDPNFIADATIAQLTAIEASLKVK